MDQLRIVDLAGGVVQDHDQTIITIILKPAMLAAVDVQHHTRHLAPRSSSTVRTAPPFPGYQSRALQRWFPPRVAQLDPFPLLELFVEVPHVQVAVLLLLQPQNRFASFQRHPPLAGLPFSPVAQTVVACCSNRSRHRRIVRGVTPMISAADSQLIRLAIAFSNTSCNFIIRSPSADGICWLGSIQTASPAAFFKRTDHVFITADKSCA